MTDINEAVSTHSFQKQMRDNPEEAKVKMYLMDMNRIDFLNLISVPLGYHLHGTTKVSRDTAFVILREAIEEVINVADNNKGMCIVPCTTCGKSTPTPTDEKDGVVVCSRCIVGVEAKDG